MNRAEDGGTPRGRGRAAGTSSGRPRPGTSSDPAPPGTLPAARCQGPPGPPGPPRPPGRRRHRARSHRQRRGQRAPPTTSAAGAGAGEARAPVIASSQRRRAAPRTSSITRVSRSASSETKSAVGIVQFVADGAPNHRAQASTARDVASTPEAPASSPVWQTSNSSAPPGSIRRRSASSARARTIAALRRGPSRARSAARIPGASSSGACSSKASSHPLVRSSSAEEERVDGGVADRPGPAPPWWTLLHACAFYHVCQSPPRPSAGDVRSAHKSPRVHDRELNPAQEQCALIDPATDHRGGGPGLRAARDPAARAGAGARSMTPSIGHWPSTSVPPTTCRRSRARRWTAMPSPPALPAAGSSRLASPAREPPPTSSLATARRSGSPPAPRCPRARRRSSPQEDVRARDAAIETQAAVRPARTSGRGRGHARRYDHPSAGTVSARRARRGCVRRRRRDLTVTRRPRVYVLCTGDELRAPGEPLGPGEIHNSNAPMLTALAAAPGRPPAHASACPTTAPPPRRDRRRRSRLRRGDRLRRRLGRAARPRQTGAGASACGEMFWGVALQPGKPTWFGTRGRGLLVFGLPGNPVSAVVTFSLFAAPALARSQGCAAPPRSSREAVLGASVRRNPVANRRCGSASSARRAGRGSQRCPGLAHPQLAAGRRRAGDDPGGRGRARRRVARRARPLAR